MGERIASFDWSRTPIGAIDTWSPALRMQVSFLLANRFPHLLWWGPDFCCIYNDAYTPVLGSKHPSSLGQPCREVWAEIWHILKPCVETPYEGGPAYWNEDFVLEINRHGFVEEGHFTVAYSPVPDDTVPGGIGGVIASVIEISGKVHAERRVAALRDLGARASEGKTPEVACAIAAETLKPYARDVPFALIYLISEDGGRASLAGSVGVTAGHPIAPASVALGGRRNGGWPLEKARRQENLLVVEDLAKKFGGVPPGPWADPPHSAIVIPIPSTRLHEPAGFLVAGISSRLALDDAYRDFFGLLATQLANILANAQAYAVERKRAEALAEIDRAKTAFFSNVSHEFRTPLTLMLGPLEDLLTHGRETVDAEALGKLEVVNRNGLRLLRLVNTLLDFSRIEAGRAHAAYRPTDLPAFTAELASVFRSAAERAGLALIVECPPQSEPTYVDRDMWEKIVLNLLSNAFKFTLEGEIAVALHSAGDHVVLEVRDTGTGIPPAEMPRLFERFHRIENARGRTHEGSGIGLALVQELVKLHGGTITARSVPDKGTTFSISIPNGTAHLPQDQVAEARVADAVPRRAGAFIEEALRWLPDAVKASPGLTTQALAELASSPLPEADISASEGRAQVLVVDDNADMREYIARLLAERFDVTAVGDGEAALRAARQRRPDLVLSDVMMPKLDGFGLLRELRADTATHEVPVILLSARAGEESRVEGLESGADDYLVKPFTARELIARVGAHVEMARLRARASRALRLSEEALREAGRRKDDFLATLSHELRGPLAPLSNMLEVLKRSQAAPERLAQAIEVMQRQTWQLARLVDDLMDVNRITRDKLELNREHLDLGKVIRELAESWTAEANSHGLVFLFQVPPEPLHINADPVRIAQVVGNLLSNACKYTDAGGRVELRLERRGGTAVITVTDTGIGVPADKLGNIFEMFFQLDRTLERSQGGLGIGLALARRLAQMHGGHIEAASAGPGLGTTMTVHLPLAMPETLSVRRSSAIADEPPVDPKRVLIVDDNRDGAASLALLLEMAGHDTRTAFDGIEAVKAAEEFEPHVVLLDLGLPLLDGHDVCRRIRQQPDGNRVKVVAVTGWSQEEDRQKSLEAGFDMHLVKPVDAETLMHVLATDAVRARATP